MGAGKLFIALGIGLIVLGLVVILAEKSPIRLGHLPGDISIHGKHTSFYFPLATCILLSLLLSFVMWILRR